MSLEKNEQSTDIFVAAVLTVGWIYVLQKELADELYLGSTNDRYKLSWLHDP